MVYYYAIATVITFLGLVYITINFENKKVNYYFLLITLLLTLANCGYLSIAVSTNVNEAVLANKISYMGGCFVPALMLFLICAVCNYHPPIWVRTMIYLYSFCVYIMVVFIGFSDFFYDSVALGTFGGATVLRHTYGPGHNFFYVIVYGYLLMQIGLLAYTLIKRRTVSRKILWTLILIEAVNIVLFGVGRILNPAIEIMPVSYAVSAWAFTYLSMRGSIYNIEDNVAISLKEQDTYAYIMFDKKLRYLGSNNVALRFFPDLSECVVDKSAFCMDNLNRYAGFVEVFKRGKTEKFEFTNNDFHYECTVKNLTYKKRVFGYILEIREDTDSWKYLQLLSEHTMKLEAFQEELETKVDEQTEEIKEQEKRIRELFVRTVTALSEAVDAKDRYTSGHSKRVAEYARMIAARMGKSKAEQDEIYNAGLLHDVGKIRVPAEIINKPGKLTDEEYNVIKIHPGTGYHILRDISENGMVALGAKYHHERYDGKGYPNGLAGEKIPEVARILGVADAYDAMASNRSYRNALPQEVVRSEIEKGRGTQFDPKIADIMLQMIDEDKEYVLKQVDSMNRRILTVDDEAMNNKVIAHIMKDEPMYEVVSVSGGKEALEILQEQRFDLILLDVKMPEMDGWETLRRIREFCQTPVVFMTGDKTLDLSEVAEYGCDDYITKPLLPILVKEIVHNMTERTRIEN